MLFRLIYFFVALATLSQDIHSARRSFFGRMRRASSATSLTSIVSSIDIDDPDDRLPSARAVPPMGAHEPTAPPFTPRYSPFQLAVHESGDEGSSESEDSAAYEGDEETEDYEDEEDYDDEEGSITPPPIIREEHNPQKLTTKFAAWIEKILYVNDDFKPKPGEIIVVSGIIVPRFWIPKLCRFFSSLQRRAPQTFLAIAKKIHYQTISQEELAGHISHYLAASFKQTFGLTESRKFDDDIFALLQSILRMPECTRDSYGVRTAEDVFYDPFTRIYDSSSEY